MFHVKQRIISGFGRATGWILGVLMLPAIWTITILKRKEN